MTSSASFCAACGAALSAGARFCHRCGTPVGQGLPVTRSGEPKGGAASVLPWGVAFLALLALVAAFAGKNFGAAKGSSVDGSSNSLPNPAIDGPAAAAAGLPGAAGAGGAAAPNIANLSPSERASRLYIRIMSYAESGNVDSVAFFAPMAMASHELLPTPSLDERYHYGRIAEVTGNEPIASAQADTILKARPTSLLGLILSARAARMRGDSATAKKVDKLLLGAAPRELASGDQDYELHRAEIEKALADARRAP